MLVRRKTFALDAESIEEALYDLESLDHDFFLFVHDESSAEAVVARVGGGYALTQRVATPEAVARVGMPRFTFGDDLRSLFSLCLGLERPTTLRTVVCAI